MIQIPNYTLKKELRSDSVSTVYLAESELLNNRLVTLTIIHNDIAKKDVFRKQFLAIGQRIQQLKHPYLTTVHAIDISRDTHNNDIICYIATEYPQQNNAQTGLYSLNDKINNETLPITTILTIIKHVGEALSYIHQQGFIHGNINPYSILFDHNNNAKLADTGFAELLEHVSSDLTSQDTLHYISPEQAAMTPTDHRTDIYSLGLVLYEMLTTQKAFMAETTAQAIYQHTMLCPADLPTSYSHIQPVLDKALAKSASDRYPTVVEMLNALEAAVEVESPPIEPQKTQKSWLVGGIIAGGFTISALMVWFFTHNMTSSGGDEGDNNQVAINTLVEPLSLPITESATVAKDVIVKPNNEVLQLKPIGLLNNNTETQTNGNNAMESTEQDKNKEENTKVASDIDTNNNDSENKNQLEKEIPTTNEPENKSSQTTQINTTETKPIVPTAADATSSDIIHAVPSSKITIKVIAEKDKKPLVTRIVITSKPSNEVIVDTKDKDLPKKQFELEVGEYEVRTEKAGYISQSQALTITDAPQDELVFRLKDIILTGQLKLTAVSKEAKNPLQADYEVRGINSDYYKQRDKRTSARFKLPTGKYRFSVHYNDKVINKTIKIEANQVINEQVAFTLIEPEKNTQEKQEEKKQPNKEDSQQDKITEKKNTEQKKSADNSDQDKAENTKKNQANTKPEDGKETKKEKEQDTKKAQQVVLGSIYMTAKLGSEQGRRLPAQFSLYQNKKLIKEITNTRVAQFQVPPGKYLIKVTYQGVSSQASAILKPNEVIEQTFVYDNIPSP